MSETAIPHESAGGGEPQDRRSVSFHTLVVQEMNMALMCLGKVPHPETGASKCDLEAAQVFIDQLEMLEVKTQGNLDKTEAALLKQALTVLRMAFVEAVNQAPGAAAAPKPAPAQPAEAPAPGASAAPAAAAEAESRKKFSKKYD